MESTANIPTGPCGPQSSPQPESHPAPQAAPVRMRRVGTLTMGCVMILAGVVICISLFGGGPSLELLFRLSPLILVALGVEVLLASRQKNQRLKYDFVSIFLSFVLVGATLCFAAVPLVWNYIGPTRAQAENNLEQQIYNRIYQQVGADTVQGMQVYVSLNALEVKNADLTLEDLSKGGSAHISIQLQPEYADPAKLAAAAADINSHIFELGLVNISVSYMAEQPQQTEYSLHLEGLYGMDQTAAQMEQQVTSSSLSSQSELTEIEERMSAQQEEFEAQLSEQQQSYEDQLAEMQQNYEQQLADMQQNYEDQLAALQS